MTKNSSFVPDRDAMKINRANNFTTSLFLGRGAFDKIESGSLEEAREAANLLVSAHQSCTRIPMVYANVGGETLFVPCDYSKADGENIAQQSIFKSRAEAQRSAHRRGLLAGSFFLEKTEEGYVIRDFAHPYI